MTLNTQNNVQQGLMGAYFDKQSESKNLSTILKEIPHKEQSDITAFLEELDPKTKQDATKKIAKLNRATLTPQELVKSINDIFQNTNIKSIPQNTSSMLDVYV